MEKITQKQYENKILMQESILENHNIKFLILCSNSLQNNIDCNKTLCFGKTIKEWVKSCAKNYSCQEIEFEKNDDILSIIRKYSKDEQITVVLYNDTPLLRHSTIMGLIENFIKKDFKVLKLQRGYIFDTAFIKSGNNFAPQYDNTQLEDFYAVTDCFTLSKVMSILKTRIMNYHLSNGVIIYDINSTFIDADCDIESGVIIYPNNVILGKTKIGANCILYPFNMVKDCIIQTSSTLSCCNLENTNIKANSDIKINKNHIE